jgi:hypothetical protein
MEADTRHIIFEGEAYNGNDFHLLITSDDVGCLAVQEIMQLKSLIPFLDKSAILRSLCS